MFLARLAMVIAVTPALLPAAGEWIRLTTPHFELLTSAGEKKGRGRSSTSSRFAAFLAASPAKHVPDFPVRIIAFRGEKQFKALLNPDEFATVLCRQSRPRLHSNGRHPSPIIIRSRSTNTRT